MTIGIFAKAHESAPWSSIFGMLSLQAKNGYDSEHPTNSTPADAIPSRRNPSPHKTTPKSGERAPKRRKLTASPSSTTLPTRPSAASRTSMPRSSDVKPPAPLPIQRVNTIERYFAASSSDEQSEQEKPALSVYDAYQKRVHDAEVKSEDKRTLRSHDDGGRLKSELAVYFPNYEVVINDLPQERELLTASTVLHITGDGSKHTTSSPSNSKASDTKEPVTTQVRQSIGNSQSSPPRKLNDVEVIDFSAVEKSVPHHPQDPLTDAVYFKPHRRAERKEKQLRNIERERAMHEKVQLERLMDGLQGHDWLRVMGISGVTDSEAQKYQVKREYFVAEVKALVTKFKQWREEEKRLKSEKDLPATRTEDEADEGEGEDEVDRASREPSSSEIDASAARQLQLEASSTKPKAKQKAPVDIVPIIYRPPTPEGPFTSFFTKPHLRTAALGRSRHGRTTLAFGHPVPEEEERDFELPDQYISPENLKESARRRRRMKRESLVDSTH